MRRIPATFAISGLALLLSSLGQALHADNYIDAPQALASAPMISAAHVQLAAAGADISIHNLAKLADGRRVRLNGTVERVQGTHSFILHDESGRIDVRLSSALPAHLKQGSGVSVAGRINRGLLGAGIEAQSVTLQHRFNEQAVSDSKPEKKVDTAPVYSIDRLPETGIVKVSGIVTTSDNASQFVLKDATGLVDVTVEEGNAVNVLKGAKVTVIGPVDRGVLGKDISAHTIIVDKNSIMASAL